MALAVPRKHGTGCLALEQCHGRRGGSGGFEATRTNNGLDWWQGTPRRQFVCRSVMS